MKTLIAAIAGSFVCLFTGTVIAIAMQPFIAPQLVPHIRTEDQGLLFPALIAGYVIIGTMLALLAGLTEADQRSWGWTFKTGTIVGLAIFLGDHLITSGWSKLAAGPMAISGLLDALSVIAAFAAAVFVGKLIGKQRDLQQS